MKAADLATSGGKGNLNTFIQYLKNNNSAIRYWEATGLLILKDDARPAISALKEASGDKSGAVAKENPVIVKKLTDILNEIKDDGRTRF